MQKIVGVNSAKMRTLRPAYPISFITGVEYESRSNQISGLKSQDLWRLFTFNGREKKEFVIKSDTLDEIYLGQRKQMVLSGIRILNPSRLQAHFYEDSNQEFDQEKEKSDANRRKRTSKLPRILKFTSTAHIDLSYKVYPDAALVTRIVPAQSPHAKALVSYFCNGLFNERYYTRDEYYQWKSSSASIYFV